jgi:hypothetical protein
MFVVRFVFPVFLWFCLCSRADVICFQFQRRRGLLRREAAISDVRRRQERLVDDVRREAAIIVRMTRNGSNGHSTLRVSRSVEENFKSSMGAGEKT